MSRRNPPSDGPIKLPPRHDADWPPDPDPHWEAVYPMESRQLRRDLVWAKRRKHPHLVQALEGLRSVMNAYGAARFCALPACRRARTCKAPRVDCGFRHLPHLQKYVFPMLDRRLKASDGADDRS